MILLLDTDVLIDCLRGTRTAQEWLEGATEQSFAIPGIVAMELVMGCQNQNAQNRILKFLKSFTIIWPEASDFMKAHELLLKYHLSTGIGIPDCLIAAMTLRRSAQLYSFNLKHFRNIQGLNVKAPYAR